MSMLDQLMEMGFSKEKSELALKATSEKSIEDALNWLEQDAKTQDKEVEKTSANGKMDEIAEPVSTCEIIQDDDESTTSTGKSLKCEDCGMLLSDMDRAALHAEKSGHQNFNESTDTVAKLTPEEKAARMKALEEKIRESKAMKEADERKKAIEMEKHRREQGQQVAAAKDRMQQEEMKKIADDRKRQKMEDKLAKQRVLDQIKADRDARKKEAQSEHVEGAKPTQKQPAHSTSAPAKSYDECKLQIRLTNGKTLTTSFGIKEQLSAVRLYIELNRTDGDEPFRLMTNFPKRVFTEEDMEKPLTELGLVPSAVLIVSKAV